MLSVSRTCGVRLLAPAIAGLAVLLGGCGGDDSGDTKVDTRRTPVGVATSPTASLASPAASVSPSPSPTPVRPASGSTYLVKSGDTLWDLALEWGVTVDAILTANSLASPDDLAIGQELKVP